MSGKKLNDETVDEVQMMTSLDFEEPIIPQKRMSLAETIACSTLFVFSVAALAAAALYDPKAN